MRLTATSQASDCYLAALRLLTGQDYTVLGLMRKLLLRRFSQIDAKAAVERLVREGYLQDRRYAERFISTARETGRFTGYRLRQELQRRGVAVELLDELLRELPKEEDQLERAQNLVARRYPGFEPQTADERERRRVAGFLQRRGYAYDVVREVLGRG